MQWKQGEKEVHAQMLTCVQFFATPCTAALQAPPSMGFSRQESWSGLPFPPPTDLPGIEPIAPALADRFFTTEPPGNPFIYVCVCIVFFSDYKVIMRNF